MTTGNRVIGTTSTPFYSSKVWSGSDGAVISTYRTISPRHSVIKYGMKKVRVAGKEYRWVTVTRVKEVPARVVQHTRRSHAQWNNYTMDAITVNRTPNLNGTWLPDWSGTVFPVQISNNGMVRLGSKITNAYRGHQFNMAIPAAQTGKTLRLCEDTVYRFTRSILALKKGNIADAARHLGANPRGASRKPKPLTSDDLSSYWLELQYGWKPLLNDVKHGAEAMAYYANKPRASRVTASIKENYTQSNVNPPIDFKFADGVSSMTYVIEDREQMSVPRSLGLYDPLSVAWELLPFSFVVDWFIPIGTYLDNLNVLPQVSGRVYWAKKFAVATTWNNYTHPFYNPGGGGTTTMRHVQLIRSCDPALYPSKPEFHFPNGKNNTTRFFNSLALLRKVLVP